jgi:hypothetical protein
VQWRQQQRLAAGGERPRLIIREAGSPATPFDEGETAMRPLDAALRSLLGRATERPVDVRERTTGILERDREELWDQSE